MNVAVLLNSQSGTAVTEQEVLAAFREQGAECEIVALSGPDPDERLVGASDEERAIDAAQRCDVLVAAGGDGTVNAAATALVSARGTAALGILPMGTANDLSRSLELPSDLHEGISVILSGRTAPLDVIGMEDGRILVNQANGGFAGSVAQELEDDTKSRWGPFGYWRASVDALQESAEYDLSIVIDGERHQLSAMNVTIANARYSGGGVPVAPDAGYADGLMDVIILESRSRLAMIPLVPQLLRGTYLDAEGVIYRKARQVEMYSNPAMPFSIDGEIREEHPRRFEVDPGRLGVRVPS